MLVVHFRMREFHWLDYTLTIDRQDIFPQGLHSFIKVFTPLLHVSIYALHVSIYEVDRHCYFCGGSVLTLTYIIQLNLTG